MLFHSSIRRELARSFGATLLVLLTIVITMLLVRTLGLANRGSVNPEEILLVLTYTVLGRMPTVLTLALFIAVVSTLSRMYRDSEMVIWFASGRGLAAFVGPVFRFAWPILVVIALMVMFVWPWSNGQTEELRERYEQRGDLERVAPGQFQESASGRRVFFIDKDTADGKEGRNIFIASTEKDGSETVTSARAGHIEWIDGVQHLVLESGQRVQQSADRSQGLRVSEFDRYTIRTGNEARRSADDSGMKTRSTWELLLLRDRPAMAELTWRAGMAITAVNFVLLALAVSAGNPRAGRSGNLIFILLAFVVYYNLLNLGQSWVLGGLVDALPLMVGLHGGVCLLSSLWLMQRHWNLRWWPRWPRRIPSGAGARS